MSNVMTVLSFIYRINHYCKSYTFCLVADNMTFGVLFFFLSLLFAYYYEKFEETKSLKIEISDYKEEANISSDLFGHQAHIKNASF